nr:immunoglobulin light chain junction region [Macaca mulatta]MPN96729.1 immunoglobulin light chain junction region [Macaca mulatta]MPO01659.1 immunoglobulin light chain junction region [Macaca mulatta]MPO02197.1 immunoglobulin light chain junction region [Macaca mulatta]
CQQHSDWPQLTF